MATAMEHEQAGIAMYHRLLDQVRDHDVALEEYARGMIANEVVHANEIEKILRSAKGTDRAN